MPVEKAPNNDKGQLDESGKSSFARQTETVRRAGGYRYILVQTTNGGHKDRRRPLQCGILEYHL